MAWLAVELYLGTSHAEPWETVSIEPPRVGGKGSEAAHTARKQTGETGEVVEQATEVVREPMVSWATSLGGQKMLKLEDPDGKLNDVYVFLEPPPMKDAHDLWPEEKALLQVSEQERKALQQLRKELAGEVFQMSLAAAELEWHNESVFTMETQLAENESARIEAGVLARLSALVGGDRALLILDGTPSGQELIWELSTYGRDQVRLTVDLNGEATPIGRIIEVKREVIRMNSETGTSAAITTLGRMFENSFEEAYPRLLAAAEKARPKR